MSGVGFSELIILFLIGLIVLGPERLPRVANQVGSWLGQARRMTRVMKRQLEEELDLEGRNTIRTPPYPRSREEAVKPQSPVERFGAEPATQDSTPANELDDTYSPAHEADSPGTGIGEEEPTATAGPEEQTGTAPVESAAEGAGEHKEPAK